MRMYTKSYLQKERGFMAGITFILDSSERAKQKAAPPRPSNIQW